MARVLLDDCWAAQSLVARADAVGDPAATALLREMAGPSPEVARTAALDGAGHAGVVRFRLSSRETQILRLVWKGSSNKAIARDLFLTENTVETHLRRIFGKLGTRNRTQAATLAREAGAI